MSLRLALYALAQKHTLTGPSTQKLLALAGLGQEPAALRTWFWRGVALLGAALGGFGIILWIAANWDTLGRMGRFVLLQGFIAAMCLGAWQRPALRAPMGLLALLATGGLFAYFGQTYQTGADTWQLFALWAGLTLLLCLGVRSDVLWVPWTLVALLAIVLWLQTHTGHRWDPTPDDLATYLLSWALAALLVLGLGPIARPFTGTGVWSVRTAVLGAVGLVTTCAFSGLFNHLPTLYAAGLFLLVASAGLWMHPRFFDVFSLSMAALGLNVLLVSGFAWWLFEERSGSDISSVMLLGLVAAGLLALTVHTITRQARRVGSASEKGGV